MPGLEIFFSLLMGIGLSAACGFRIFIPPLLASIAALTGHLTLTPEFAWLGTYPVLIALSIAALLEIAGYFIPIVDHFLDMVTTPAAIVAGTLLTASFAGDMDPTLKWTLAAIVGGGAAVAMKASLSALRLAATATTAGLGNSVVALAELAGALVIVVLALLAPLIAVIAALVLAVFAIVMFIKVIKRVSKQKQSTST